jgi:hypothetical protein
MIRDITFYPELQEVVIQSLVSTLEVFRLATEAMIHGRLGTFHLVS